MPFVLGFKRPANSDRLKHRIVLNFSPGQPVVWILDYWELKERGKHFTSFIR